MEPKLSLDKVYSPHQVEEKWQLFWEKGNFSCADPDSKKPPFSIILPPPNITGVLHMGHALVDTLQDILIRKKRMEGFEVLWVPGVDHAGIATQAVVERKLYQETGKRRQEFLREEFLEHIWQFKQVHERQIQIQLRKLGCSLDWSRYRFTMDEASTRAVRKAFQTLFEKKWIYRGDYLVHWDPVTQTALSDDEVEYEEKQGSLWYIRYYLEGKKEYLVIATTRPETLLGDVAVAVHPEDPRFQSFLGKSILLPFTHRKIPILADSFVDPNFGSGAVKITPAHDFQDYEVGIRHNLPLINILTPDGKINEQGTKLFAGLSIEEAREKILQELKQQQLLEKVEPYPLRLGYSYRSKGEIQPYLSKQWFIHMKPFKQELISCVREKKVHMIPSHWEETYFHWIENLRDWCISRQLWWGHQIPIWYHKTSPEKMLCQGDLGVPEEVKKHPEMWVQDPDVLDTWFSSALWPFSSLGWPDSTPLLDRFYPTSTLLTGHDILFFWVARMIFMGNLFMKKVPFQEAFIHGLIYGKSYYRLSSKGIEYASKEEKRKWEEEGVPPPKEVHTKWEKMSKSKGNVIDPLEMVQKYGADALRMTLAFSATQARQIDLDRRRFEEFRNFTNKIWNGARFVFMHLLAEKDPLTQKQLAEKDWDPALLTLEDRWIFSRLNQTIDRVNGYMDQYAFDKAAATAYDFYWNQFCSLYVELVKPVLFGKRGDAQLRKNRQKILAFILEKALRLMHPICPFVTEEIFSYFQLAFGQGNLNPKGRYAQEFFQAIQSPCCMVAPYPKKIQEEIDLETEKSFSHIEKLLHLARNLRGEMELSPGEKTSLYVIGKKKDFLFLLAQKQAEMFWALLPLQELFFTEEEPEGFGATAVLGEMKLFIPLSLKWQQKEKERLLKEKEKWLKAKDLSEKQLQNTDFLQKAPKQVVQNFERQLKEAKSSLTKILQKLQGLGL